MKTITITATILAASMAAFVHAVPVLEPATQKFIDGLAAAGGPPLYTLSPDDARKVLAGAQAAPVTKLPASIEDTTFPVGPTGKVAIRIVRPQGAKGVLPVVMHFHGGGWILGDKNTHDRMTREISVGSNAAVVFVDYDRSPKMACSERAIRRCGMPWRSIWRGQ
jgi:acetyl esterase